VRADVLFAVLASDFGVELVVGEGPFREPPTVMQPTIHVFNFSTLDQAHAAVIFDVFLLLRLCNFDTGEQI